MLSKSEISQIIRGKGGGGLWKMNLVALKKLLDEYIVKEGERVLRIKKTFEERHPEIKREKTYEQFIDVIYPIIGGMTPLC